MADALVSIVLEQLLSVPREQIDQKVHLVSGIEEEIEKLTSNFRAIQYVLEDAEKRQVKEASVRGWLETLKDACYNIDDVLDEWSTAILKHQIEGVAPKKVFSFLPSPSYLFSEFSLRHDIAVKIKELNKRLDVIAKERETYSFELKRRSEEPERLKTTSFIDVSEVKGIASDKKTIIDRLLCANSQEEKGHPIISIVGLGGMGKTTLAQLVYNDDDVKTHFEKMVWVCVSDPFDDVKIAKAILEKLQGASPNLNELNALHEQIHDSVKGKKLLLVLDDVWTEDYSKWERLKSSLKYCAKGSRVLVTTRSERVAKLMGTTHTHNLRGLSEPDCWSLFSQIAFLERSIDEYKNLEEIGRKLVEKCKGLPLAAKTLGSLMRLKDSKEEWEVVLDSEVWEEEVVENNLSGPLLLSYYNLPHAIKRCFSYCAVFPKDTQINTRELIQLWMAQGYLNSKKKNVEMEITGKEYFKNLAMRSLFQDVEMMDLDGSIGSCKMHDIVHDFTQFLMKNECIITENNDVRELGKESSSIQTRVASLTNMKNLRTLLFGLSKIDLDFTDLCNRLTCLRALDMSKCSLIEIPMEVGKLIHLRYLNLAWNRDLKELPEEVCELCNLQTLNLDWCTSIERLPQGIGRLIKLRHLELVDTDSLKVLPKGIGRLSSLRALTKFIVSDDCKLGELRSLNHLRFLGIYRLQKVTDARELNTELKKMKHLRLLGLWFNEQVMDYQVLEVIQIPSQLESLGIDRYGGTTLSTNWITSLSKLKALFLEDFNNWECLAQLGRLPSLESLRIWNMRSVKRVGAEFLGIEINNDNNKKHECPFISFPKLKQLEFLNMFEWEEWEWITDEKIPIIMPCLRFFTLGNCPKLKALPDHFVRNRTFQKLTIYNSPPVSEQLRELEGRFPVRSF